MSAIQQMLLSLGANKERLVIAGNTTSPYVSMYTWTDSSFVETMLLDEAPPASTNQVAISDDGQYLAISLSVATSPNVFLYKKSENGFSRIADLPDLPTDVQVRDLKFSTGAGKLAVAFLSTPGLVMYSRSGDVFTKLPAISGIGGIGVQVPSVAFSGDGNYFAAIFSSPSPYIALKSISGNTFTTVGSFASIGLGREITLSHDGTYIAVADGNTPRIHIYRRVGTTVSKLSAQTAISSTAYAVEFSPDAQYLFLGTQSVGERLVIYKRTSDTTFTRLPAVVEEPPDIVVSLACTSDGKYLLATDGSSPYLYGYTISDDTLNRIDSPSIAMNNQKFSLALLS